MIWQQLIWFAAASILCWVTGAVLAFKVKSIKPAAVVSFIGSAIFLSYIVVMWVSLERPPMRTMGETRLWYSFFLSLAGLAVFVRWQYRWVLSFSTMMSVVFICINLFKPEIHSKSLMPALQSVWFVPHVIVYMFAYAMMGAVTLFALYLWFRRSKQPSAEELGVCDNLVRIGWAFLTLGMVMGALWAKQAWGDYWTWDPKETWAAATWLSYLLYLHLRPHIKDNNVTFALIIFSFLLLQMCWYGINFLPSAQGASVHVY
ncbi:MAG: cytochrome C assembly protein [Rikenellaceae bacterium]|nr:cytochrome C assembly protein [Rikenellaceae bacterium]